MTKWLVPVACLFCFVSPTRATIASEIRVTETDDAIQISTSRLEAAIRKKGYVSGVARQSFLDKKTGFRDPGFGLDIVDFLMEPGSDEAYRDQIEGRSIVYEFGNLFHGKRAKRLIEGPQICTRARELDPVVIRGDDFLAVRQKFKYHIAAPGRQSASTLIVSLRSWDPLIGSASNWRTLCR